VYGVTEVSNGLQVRMLDGSRRGDLLQALMLDSFVPTTVDAKVRDGIVALTGTAPWRYQRDEAEFLTASVPSVADPPATAIEPGSVAWRATWGPAICGGCRAGVGGSKQ
jgi:hypothetical protein